MKEKEKENNIFEFIIRVESDLKYLGMEESQINENIGLWA